MVPISGGAQRAGLYTKVPIREEHSWQGSLQWYQSVEEHSGQGSLQRYQSVEEHSGQGSIQRYHSVEVHIADSICLTICGQSSSSQPQAQPPLEIFQVESPLHRGQPPSQGLQPDGPALLALRQAACTAQHLGPIMCRASL